MGPRPLPKLTIYDIIQNLIILVQLQGSYFLGGGRGLGHDPRPTEGCGLHAASLLSPKSLSLPPTAKTPVCMNPGMVLHSLSPFSFSGADGLLLGSLLS